LFSVDIDPNKYVAETVYGQCSTSEQGIIMTLDLIPGITMTLDPIPVIITLDQQFYWVVEHNN
jgi:hypothetical protein